MSSPSSTPTPSSGLTSTSRSPHSSRSSRSSSSRTSSVVSEHAPAYADLRARLEDNLSETSLVALEEVAADPYVRLADPGGPKPRSVAILTAAIVIRSLPRLVTDTGQIQLVDTDTGDRVGYAYVSLDWIRAYRDAEIDRHEFGARVLETFQRIDREDVTVVQGTSSSESTANANATPNSGLSADSGTATTTNSRPGTDSRTDRETATRR